jgi:hypothetical protein
MLLYILLSGVLLSLASSKSWRDLVVSQSMVLLLVALAHFLRS